MSVYSTIPNSNIFFKHYNQSNDNENNVNNNNRNEHDQNNSFNDDFLLNFNRITNNNNNNNNNTSENHNGSIGGNGNGNVNFIKNNNNYNNGVPVAIFKTAPTTTLTPLMAANAAESPSSSLNNEEFHIALTPPNTPTHGVLINTIDEPPSDDIDNYDNYINDPFGQPRKSLFNENDQSTATQSTATPIDLRSMCDTPDSQEQQYHIPQLSHSNTPKWNELNFKGKLLYLLKIIAKFLAIILSLYTFICSLELLSTAFRLLGARVIGNFFQNSQLLSNPIVGLMIGVLVTVLVQSSSTSTSITVTMVASRIIHVRQAIPIMMGANIGTSVTNTIVSLMQSADREEFGRAFAAATVHDMFNWLTVIVLLPLEMTTHYLEHVTTYFVDKFSANDNNDNDKQSLNDHHQNEQQFLNRLTKPLTNRIIQIDKELLEEMAYGNQTLSLDPNRHLLIRCCSDNNIPCHRKCSLFGWLGFADTPTGLILLSLSILILCLCLMSLVKVLNSMLTGQIAKLIKRTMNRQYTFPYSLIADYTSILVGCILTILVQSSSIFTSALTPLAGIGIITIERIYPLTLGANIGTTTTGILAALASERNRLHDTMQIALCHLFFNITGILIFYPIPFMRLPIPMAKMLGYLTAKYRWFSIFYLLIMFFLLPLIIFSLSTLGITIMLSILIPIIILIILIIIINLLQHYHAHWLPLWIRNWHFLPLYLRSLDPLDNLIMRLSERFGCMNCFATSGQLQHMRFERCDDANKLLGHHTDTQNSRLNILGSMYRSNSEQNLNENLIALEQRKHRHHYRNHYRNDPYYYQQHSVPETIKKVISKLTNQMNTTNHHNQNQQRRRFNSHGWYHHQLSTPNDDDNDNNDGQTRTRSTNWSLFNSHTVHIGSQLHRYHGQNRYKNLPFISNENYNEFISSQQRQQQQQQQKQQSSSSSTKVENNEESNTNIRLETIKKPSLSAIESISSSSTSSSSSSSSIATSQPLNDHTNETEII